MAEQRITIYDIAKAVGVSASTVSRVINNKPGVNVQTRNLILDYLKNNPYTPNEVARGLSTQYSKLIGILISNATHHMEGVYYIEQEMREHGYSCLFFNAGKGAKEKANQIMVLRKYCVEAAVLIGSTFQTEEVKKALLQYLPRTPVFMVNGTLELPNTYCVVADDQNGVNRCVQLLYEKGRKKLAFIYDHNTASNTRKKAGFVDGIRLYYPHTTPLFIESETENAYQATIQLLKQHPEVDGIIYAVDFLAMSGIRALHDMHIPIPQQVAVIGIGNSKYAEISYPALTSLDNQRGELSSITARNLIDKLSGKEIASRVMVLSSIAERETT